MNLNDIMDKCSKLKMFEQRQNAEDYKELVFFKTDLKNWTRIFEDCMGPAVKPSGKEPLPEHLRVTENFGGIHRQQTLYQRKDNGSIIIAMLWPWQDKEHITLKLAVFK